MTDEDKSIVIMPNGDVLEQKAWDQLPGEPDKWFLKFQRYYITLGVERTVKKACEAFCAEERPERLDPATGKLPYPATPRAWSENAFKWRWKDRAMAFDRYSNNQILDTVQFALSILKDSAPDAAEALVEALSVPRTRVSAAKEILDRIGLPAVKRVESIGMQVTPDDVQKAREELEEWKRSQQNG